MNLKSLKQDDGDALARFPCGISGQPWTRATEIAINEHLHHAIVHHAAEAIGIWDGDTLAAVAAWKVDPYEPDIWRCTTVAVRSGYKRRGLGEQLKREVLNRARAAGARRVDSTVHRDNDPMLGLNAKLGAAIHPEGVGDYLLCVIAL